MNVNTNIAIARLSHGVLYNGPMRKILSKEAADLLRISRITLWKWGELKKIRMWREGQMRIRVFDYDEIKRLGEKLPKKRGKFAIYVEKDLRRKKK